MSWLASTLPALVLAAVVGAAVRVRARRPAPAALSELEVERSVRDRLYGERRIETLRET
jgi:hypothetical protein